MRERRRAAVAAGLMFGSVGAGGAFRGGQPTLSVRRWRIDTPPVAPPEFAALAPVRESKEPFTSMSGRKGRQGLTNYGGSHK